MASTSKIEKGPIDYLWEWANENGYWSKSLVKMVVSTESNLTESDRKSVFDKYLGSIGVKETTATNSITKPSYSPTNHRITLESLSSIRGVNRLAENQTLKFSPNITIVYGQNGTGKTGYVRILKSLGFSYESRSKIFSDISEEQIPQSGKISYKLGEEDKTTKWNGIDSNSELEGISVFNNNCVNITLTSVRELIVTPIGFHLFNIVTKELDVLLKMLDTEIENCTVSLEWAEKLNEGTEQHSFINKILSHNIDKKLFYESKIKTLKELSKWDSLEDQAKLDQQEEELKGLNKELLLHKSKLLDDQITELNEIKSRVEAISSLLTKELWESFLKQEECIQGLRATSKSKIEDVAKENEVKFYKSEQFNSFIKVAEEYIKLLDKESYPKEGDECVYCKQPLQTEKSIELLNNYRRLLNSDTESKLLKAKESLDLLKKEVSNIQTDYVFHQKSFGETDKGTPVQPEEIILYSKNLELIKSRMLGNTPSKDLDFEIDYNSILQLLLDRIRDLSEEKEDIDKKALNPQEEENKIKKLIKELKDRKLLSEKKEEVVRALDSHKMRDLLYSNRSSFFTTKISKKATKARRALLAKNFEGIFQGELKKLKKSHLPIELNFGTEKGKTKIKQSMHNNFSLLDVLSEGEQKAIALAEFLTELQLDPTNAPVVFDDPVNSFDHIIIDDFAERLVELSSDRQIVVFTHSILLYNKFLDIKLEATTAIQLYNVTQQYGKTGVLSEGEELNSVGSYIKKVKLLIDGSEKDRREEQVSAEGYGHLRSAVELCIEHEVLKGTVERYKRNISLGKFLRIDGDLINNNKRELIKIFKTCCKYIDGHSNPAIIDQAPTLTQLKKDFEDFKEIRKKFK
ncbi:AAA family ATPase [Ichthyobacterium seriolicida]|uniref:Protein CR006 P-loop domain-containing protein n=1 Tax=Ichthyobacterium seriolicida TaxID=242600 RepID=A0A1J1DXZ8_9FLAO|nr:hypothetical protein [Ichthyobacterium seriolicida]BAV94729.1 hypothetical protein JBKA6_0716 [Ichthyobacterium seriolicida]